MSIWSLVLCRPLVELSQPQEKQLQFSFPPPEKSSFCVHILSPLSKGSVKLQPNHVENVSRREAEQEKEFYWIEEGAGDELHSRM